MANYTILVTGGLGFIGSAFIRYLFSLGSNFNGNIINIDNMSIGSNIKSTQSISNKITCDRYKFLKINLCDKLALENLFATYDINLIVHFAANSHVDRSITTPISFVENNIIGTLNLLEVAHKAWNNKKDYRLFHFVSTDEVYGDLPLDSTKKFTETDNFAPRSPYAASKASCEHLVSSYHHTFKMNISISRSSNNFGPYQADEKFIPLMIKKLRNHENLPIYGTGKNIRDWISVNDNVCAILKIIESKPIYEIYNIAGVNKWRNIDLVEKIIKNFAKITAQNEYDLKKLIAHVTDRPGHDRQYSMDCSKIKNKLNWTAQGNFDKDLFDTVKWYIDND